MAVYRAAISHHEKIVFRLSLIINHYILPSCGRNVWLFGDIPARSHNIYIYIYAVSTVRNVYAVYLMDFAAIPRLTQKTAPHVVLRRREPLA